MEGPAVELEATEGGGSGTAAIAEVWARVFPLYWPTIKGLIDNGGLPAERYAFGPYPDDKLLIHRTRQVSNTASLSKAWNDEPAQSPRRSD